MVNLRIFVLGNKTLASGADIAPAENEFAVGLHKEDADGKDFATFLTDWHKFSTAKNVYDYDTVQFMQNDTPTTH